MKIKADEQLFNEWNALVERIRIMNAIVQNDMEVEREELFKWYYSAIGLTKEMQNLTTKIFNSLLAEITRNA